MFMRLFLLSPELLVSHGDGIKGGGKGGKDEWDPFILLGAEKQEENKVRAGRWSAGNVGIVADGRAGPQEGEKQAGLRQEMGGA